MLNQLKNILRLQLTSLGFLIMQLFIQSTSFAIGQVKFTYTATNTSLSKIMEAVKIQTGYNFIYSPLLNDNLYTEKYTVKFSNEELTSVLKYLSNTSKNIKMYTKGKNIFLDLKSNRANRSLLDSIPEGVKGIVMDKSGNIIPGATIQVKNSTKGTTTDNSGKFNIPNIEKGSKIIVSSVGYESREFTANNKSIIAELSPFINVLNETQIVAYGKTSKKLNTGNVTSVKASEFEKMPISNPMLALQGRIPGLDIQPSNGLPGAGVSLRIQNAFSILSGSDPLIVIDEIPYPSQLSGGNSTMGMLGTNGGTEYGQIGSPLSYLNSKDIESITVLKGADATSIYGSRAANGAVLIVTKKGKVGKTEVSVDFQAGIKNIGKELKLLNTPQYLNIRREAFSNSNSTPTEFDYDVNGFWDTTASHNWQKELVGRNAFNMNTSLSINGGSENIQYLISGTFSKENSIFPDVFNPFDDKRGSGHISLTSTSSNKKLRVNFSTSYMYDKNRLPSTSNMPYALKIAPDAPDLLDQNGNINWKLNASGRNSFGNPLYMNLNPYAMETTSLISSLNIGYEILPNLKISSNFGYNSIVNEETSAKTLESLGPYFVRNKVSPATLTYQNRRNSIWNIEPQINYSFSTGKHNIQALLGSTFTNSLTIGRGFTGFDFPTDLLINDIASATTLAAGQSQNTIYRYTALFGRLVYNYDQKYILQLTGRRDGSSRFGTENKFHTFGSIGGAWIISEENFIKDNLKALSLLKIRSSYGTTGNDQIGDYQYLTLYQATPNGRAYQSISGLGPTALSNPYLQWEEVKKWEAGLDIGLFDNRILLQSNYNLNTSSNQLNYLVLPITTGFPYIAKNYNYKVRSSALEVSLNTVNIRSNRFTWSSIFTLTGFVKSKLIKFDDLDQSTFKSTYTIGKSTNIRRVVKYAGVNETTGDFEFYDSKGNKTYYPDPFADATETIPLDPKYYGGISNTLNYQNFTLTFSFNFDKRINLIQYLDIPGGFNTNVATYMLDRWQKPGDKATYQRFTSDGANGYQYYLFALGSSDASYQNIFFLRCGNIAFTWELPAQWKQAMRMSNCNIYAQVMNPFVISNNNMMLDPQTGNNIPLLKAYNLGIKATF